MKHYKNRADTAPQVVCATIAPQKHALKRTNRA